MPRSIRVHPDHRPTVALALERNGFLTQGDLAAHLEIALSTVSNFCRGVKVSIAKFEEISEALGLEARALIQATEAEPAHRPGAQDAPPTDFYAYDAAWVGRASLIATLTAQVQGACRCLMITGIAGVGKTALAERLSLELSALGALLRENCDAQDQSLDFGSFAARLLEKLGQMITPSDSRPERLRQRTDVQQLRTRLVEALQTRPCLVVIDSFEALLQGNEQAGWSEFKDPSYLSFFQQCLAAEQFQSRLIITAQELPTQLMALGSRYRNFWFVQPLTGLDPTEQLALFATTGLATEPDAVGLPYLVRIGQAYEGHPLALRVIIGEIGSRPFFGDVLAYWHRYGQEIEVVEAAIAAAAAGQTVGAEDKWQLDRFTRTLRRNVRSRLEQTFQRLQRDVKWAYILICEASVYRCAVPEDWWLSHLDYWDCEPAAGLVALDALKDRFLVEEVLDTGEHGLRQHNLIRSVALEHLQHLGEE